MSWLTVLSNLIIVPAALLIAGSLLYLAFKYRTKRLSSALVSFGFLFFVGGLERLEHLKPVPVLWWQAVTTALVAVAVVICAAATIKCAGNALYGFTRMAVWERRLNSRIAELEQRGDAYASDVEFVVTLREIRDQMRVLISQG